MTFNDMETVFAVNVNTPAIYTAAHFFCGLPMAVKIKLSGVPKNIRNELTIKISVIGRDEIICERTVKIPDFKCEDYTLCGSDTVVLNIEKYKIMPDAKFMDSLSASMNARVKVNVSFDGLECSGNANIRILPFGHVSSEMPHELICTYVLPGSAFAQRNAKGMLALAEKFSAKHPKNAPWQVSAAEAIFTVLQDEKISYAAHLRELCDSECVLRDQDVLLSSNIKSMSFTEAALLYCSCAERCGLRPSIIYLRKGAGAVRVLVGISLSDVGSEAAVSESIAELRERILARELLVFDVAGFLGTEEPEFSRVVSDTAALVFKVSSTVAFAVSVFASRLCGVSSLRPYAALAAPDIYGGFESVAESVEKIEKKDAENTVFGYSPYLRPSLGIALSGDVLCHGKSYTLSPLDDDVLCSEPDSLAQITTFPAKAPSEKARNNSDKAHFEEKSNSLRIKIEEGIKRNIVYAYPAKYTLLSEKLYQERLRDEFYGDALKISDKVATDEISGVSCGIYAAVGIVELTEGSERCFAPCAFVPCTLSYRNNSAVLLYGSDKPVYNKKLLTLMCEHIPECDFSGVSFENISVAQCTDIFRELSEKSSGKAIFHPDTLVSYFDLSYTFMRECLESADGRKFEKYLEDGKYEFTDEAARVYGRFESTLPFGIPSMQRRAVKCAEKDSEVISGLGGTGKKKTVANIISRAYLTGGDVLVSSKYKDSLYSLRSTMKSASLDELCLIIDGRDKTKKQILSDIERLEAAPEIPETHTTGDISALEKELEIYEGELYSEYDFGYSLFDCMGEYCRYELLNGDKPVEIGIELGNLSRESAKKLFDISEKLSKSAFAVCSELNGKTIADCGFGHVRTTAEVAKSFRVQLEDASAKLSLFAEKSAFARKTLGLSANMLTDVRALCALGEFFGLLLKSGIDYLPEEIFSSSAYRSAKSIEKICDILEELSSVNSKLSEHSDKISQLQVSELYRKWKAAESNPFARNSIAAELKKSLPDKAKLSTKEAGKILELLLRRETLENELSLVSPEGEVLLGALWRGSLTDTVKARHISKFALCADSCIKKIFRSDADSAGNIYSGVARLVSAIMEDRSINADFILACGAMSKLAGENTKGGLLGDISNVLSVDLSDIKFEDGILSSEGLGALLMRWAESFAAIQSLSEYNKVKKAALGAGLDSFVSYIENTEKPEEASALFAKSIFSAFASYIISSKKCFTDTEASEKFTKYREMYYEERKLAVYNIISSHRRAFSDYVSSDAGRSELYALRESLADSTVSVSEIFSRHSMILRVMYTAIFMTTYDAYRLSVFPQTLVLFDADKTDSAEAIPLCARFDKCIFISSPYEKSGSIVASLPLGIPHVNLSRILCEKSGHIAAFIGRLLPESDITFTRETDFSKIKLISCPGGLYDKNTKTNKIEAVKACETALSAARTYGFENVGIIALTCAQALEIKKSLELLSGKYAEDKIKEIPVRYIGSIGDFSKDCIVLSVSFGKNIYSVCRSFGLLDDPEQVEMGGPIPFKELLSAQKSLLVVSSVQPEEIMTDGACKGASAVAELLDFVKYHCVKDDSVIYDKDRMSASEMLMIRELSKSFGTASCYGTVITSGMYAYIYENGYIRDVYDRIILPDYEYTQRGYKVRFITPYNLLHGGIPTLPKENTSEK